MGQKKERRAQIMPQYSPVLPKKELEALRVLFYSNLTPACFVAEDGTFLQVNDAWAKLVRYPKSQLVGKMRWQDITVWKDIQADQDMVDSIIHHESDKYDNWKTYIRGDNTTVDVYLHVRPVLNEDGSVDFFVSQAASKDEVAIKPNIDLTKNQKVIYSNSKKRQELALQQTSAITKILWALVPLIGAITAYISQLT